MKTRRANLSIAGDARGWGCRLMLVLACSYVCAAGDEIDARRLEQEYHGQVGPLIKRYCLKCHSSKEPEGETDLEKLSSWSEIRRGRKVWQRVGEILAKGEMPPPDEVKPAADEMRVLRGWVRGYLDFEARERQGDPGRVVMRRLSNVEYNNTVHDLTGIPLEPAREFPADGAAGEGFTNTGDALVMSPAFLSKYLEAAKEIASHAVLLPDGFRFSRASSRRDWTDEILAEIRRIYDRFASKDGKAPLEAYLSATVALRAAAESGKPLAVDQLAVERGLSAKYLRSLWRLFQDGDSGDENPPGRLIDGLRARWRAARAGDVAALAGEIGQWQQASWRFNSVGHAFTTAWQEPISPVVRTVTLRQPPAPPGSTDDVVLYLSAGTAGDGSTGDVVVWGRPRLEIAGRPPIFLRDARGLAEARLAARERIFAKTTRYLAAAAEATAGMDSRAIADLAARHDLELTPLLAWLDYLGIRSQGPAAIEGYYRRKIMRSAGYEFIQGWGFDETPSVVANSSDREARIPGLLKPHKVAVHPSPTLASAIGWRSPTAGRVNLKATVVDADPACGNGATWSIELRRGRGTRRLASGSIENGGRGSIEPIENLEVYPGDLITLLIGPRDGNHGCDLTEVDLDLAMAGDPARTWQLARDVSGDLAAANPHGDRLGNADTWHFFSEPVKAGESPVPSVPGGSVLARWIEARTAADKSRLAQEAERLLTAPHPPTGASTADHALFRQMTSLSGPVLGAIAEVAPAVTHTSSKWGVDPGLFGRGPGGTPIDPASFCVQAHASTVVRLPADLVPGREFVVTAELAPGAGAAGSVQPRLTTTPPDRLTDWLPGVPVLAGDGTPARVRLDRDLAAFRRWFPAAVCFPQIVPIDEVVTMVQFFRADEPLGRLFLDDETRARLDRLWDELRYVSQDALRVYQNFDQMLGFASQEGDTAKVESWRKPITERAEALQKIMAASEPVHLESLIRWANRAYRRPLAPGETDAIRAIYAHLRADKLGHDEALRLVMARVLVSPSFLYRVEQPGPGSAPAAVTDWELASRLSYFLWASMPDAELFRLAETGRLHEPAVLAAQVRRLLGDGRARALATEFACQWLEINDFAQHDEKSERHFPTFAGIRGDLHEESVRFFLDLFQRDGSILDIVDADRTVLNQRLAEHYGIPGVVGAQWRSVDGIKRFGRGGVLGLGAVLAKQSGASRTSPVLRGNWLVETLLGERLPRPPKNVPRLPDDEAATDGLTMRQLVERHRANPQCASCHDKIDAFGFALEGFDAIGRARTKDLGDRPIDTRVTLKDGTVFDGLDGLRDYLLNQRKEQFARNVCRKLLGYALGRAVQLSDEVLIEEIMRRLVAQDFRFGVALEQIVLSKPFREHRGVVDDID